jgi:hypothetical protein
MNSRTAVVMTLAWFTIDSSVAQNAPFGVNQSGEHSTATVNTKIDADSVNIGGSDEDPQTDGRQEPSRPSKHRRER